MKKAYIIEVAIFIFLLSILTLLGIKIFKHTFDIGTTYHVAFRDIDSIVVGSPVKLLGVDIGHVTKLKSASDIIYVDFVISDPKLKLPEGTTASIEFFGIAGSRSIALTPPDKNSTEKGIIIKEPIRIGDAFDIMAKFIRATMVSIGGLYEFAKDKDRATVDRMTKNFLITTSQADDKVINVTNKIEKGGTNLRKTLTNTTDGMEKINNHIESLNVAKKYNLGKYTINISRRSLVKWHKQIKIFNENSNNYTQTVSAFSGKLDKTKSQLTQIEEFYDAMNKFNDAVNAFNNSLTQENLDKVYDSVENLKLFSENLNAGI